jgi:hypothetical protein
MTTNYDLSELDKLAFNFFKMFAQFESTLKENGFFTVGSHGNVKADWDRFANEKIGTSFPNSIVAINEAINYILDEPPMRQGVDANQRITWLEVLNTDKTAPTLFRHIRRMRNNLFHGAKFNETWFAPERSQKLLQNGLAVLGHYRSYI